MPDETRRFVEVGGARLEVLEAGAGAGAPTLVFLHEGLGSAAQWRDVPARLAGRTGCATLVYSRRGYGRSDKVRLPRPLTYMHDEARLLPELLAACDVRRSILVGHSDGASIALLHAATRPAGLLGLVLEAPHVFVEDVSVASIARAREAFESGPLREGLAKYHDDPDGAFWGWNRAWLDPGFRTWNLEAEVARIVAPTLVIQGEDDPYGTLAQVDAIDRALPAGAERVILPACGHAPHRDQPEATLEAMSAFVLRALRRRD